MMNECQPNGITGVHKLQTAIKRSDAICNLQFAVSNSWLWAISIIVIIALAVVIWWLLVRRQRWLAQEDCRLEIANLGNVRSRYELQAKDPADALRFTFEMGGSVLETRGGKRKSRERAGNKHKDREKKEKPSIEVGAGLKKAKGAKNWMVGAGNTVANMLGTLGMMLPSSIGGPLRQAAGQIRRGRASVSRAERVSGQVSRLKRKGAKAHPPKAVEKAPPEATPTLARPGSTEPSTDLGWVRTPFVEPGETVSLKLLIDPRDISKTESYTFTVNSHSLEQPGRQAIVEESEIEIEGLNSFQRYGPFLVVLTAAMTMLFILSLLISGGR